jgi:formamidopyrimidine-DNA glycosylase
MRHKKGVGKHYSYHIQSDEKCKKCGTNLRYGNLEERLFCPECNEYKED